MTLSSFRQCFIGSQTVRLASLFCSFVVLALLLISCSLASSSSASAENVFPSDQNISNHQDRRLKLKVILISPSARNKSMVSNVGMYELNSSALSMALREAYESGLVDLNTTDVELVYCDATGPDSTKAMLDLLHMNATPQSFQVLLGPFESTVARNVNFLMQALSKPHIVWGATAPELSDRFIHPRVIRPHPNYYLVTQCFEKFFVTQNLTAKVAVLYYQYPNRIACPFMAASLQQTASSCKSSVVFLSKPTLKRISSCNVIRDYMMNPASAVTPNFEFSLFSFNNTVNITITNYALLYSDTTDEQLTAKLLQISTESRIIFGCGMLEPGNLTRTIQLYRIMAAAKQLGMTDPSYQWIFFMTDVATPIYHPLYLPSNKNIPSPEKILKDNNISLTLAELSEAMKRVIYLYHRMLHRGDFAWREKVLEAIAEPPWNENMTRVRADLAAIGITDASSAYMSGHLADSLTLYLKGVKIARETGRDYQDPYAMYDILRNITFEGHSGYFALNRDGERLPDLALHGPAPDYNSKSPKDKFEEKGTMRCSIYKNIMDDSNGIDGQLELEKPFVWYTADGLPPPSTPACGFRNELCRFNPIYIVLIVVGGVAVLSCIIGTTVWTIIQQRRKAELLRMDWLLQADQIQEGSTQLNGASYYSNKSVGSISLRSNSSSTLQVNSGVVGGVQKTRRGSNKVMNFGDLWGSGDEMKTGTVTIIDDGPNSEYGDSGADDAAVQTQKLRRNFYSRAMYHSAPVALYKWPWTTNTNASGNVLHRNFSMAENKKRFAPILSNENSSGKKKSSPTASGGAAPTSSSTLVAYVLEHHECLHELLAMRHLNHDNVCPFIGAYYANNTHQLVFVHAYCHKGTLNRVLQRHQHQRNNHQPLQWFFKQSILLDIALGLDYLHNSTQLEFHGRLSSDYVVIDSRWVTKLTGFGRWSFGIEHPEDFLQFESADEDEVEAYKRRLLWTAPEILRQPSIVSDACSNFNATSKTNKKVRDAVAAMRKADVYSLGVITSEVIYDIEPFSERLDASGNVMSASKVVAEIMRPPKLTEALVRPLSDKDDAIESVNVEEDATAINICRRLMIRCWAEDPADRPKIKQVCQSLRAQARARGTGSLVDTVIAKLELYAKNLESLVQARTNDLQEEKRRADGLLRRLLPEPVAEQLKRGEPIVPQMYESASVYFSDIVSFTTIASLLTPLAVVDLLNKVFMYMDDVLSRYAVYKVETIGDGYMVVSGLPKRISTHAAELASLALDIRNGIGRVSIESLQQQPNQSIRIRLGLHSGPVVAGIVGLTMPRYCLFGDTVNVASRMESQGEPMQIQISESTRQLLGPEYIGRERGTVKIKGKGEMHTYWLDQGPTRAR